MGTTETEAGEGAGRQAGHGEGDDLRAGLHGMWAAVAPAWGENAEFIEERGTAVTELLLDLVRLEPGDRVLELACGPGSVGIAAAERVGAGGEVVLSDVAAPMVEIALGRARERGVENVSGRPLDLETIDQPDDSFDVVLCREGINMVPDPERAAREIHRVLRPGGRVALSVWGPREINPWLTRLFDAVTAELGHPVPPPGLPGPFSLEDRDRVEAILTGAGFADVGITPLDVPLRAPSADVWFDRSAAMAGPLARMLAMQSEEVRSAIRERATASVAEFETADGVEIPGVCWNAAGRIA